MPVKRTRPVTILAAITNLSPNQTMLKKGVRGKCYSHFNNSKARKLSGVFNEEEKKSVGLYFRSDLEVTSNN